MASYKNVDLDINHDVSTGNLTTRSVVFEGSDTLLVQIYYKNLSLTTNTIQLQQSNDGRAFVNSKDSNGDLIRIVLDNSLTTDILNVKEFCTNHFRFVITCGGTGTIEKLDILIK